MHTRTHLLLIPGLFALMLGVACGDEDESNGTAPTIDSLSYDPTTITVGSNNDVTASFNYADPEGDVSMFQINVSAPDGVVVPAIQGEVPGATGQTAGAVTLVLSLNPPLAGSYDFTITITDEAGNTSKGLSGTLTAQ
ncbi:MAG: hypothetical protein CMH57_07840 [Myxococcales bacterium]|nr:hypothetical protein [Myxococcales bacterium]